MTKYSERLGDKICEHIATSSLGLRHICKRLNMPYSTVTNWIYKPGHELRVKYFQAKDIQIYHIADEILEIADDSTNDYMEVIRNGKKKIILNKEAISRSRLRINTRISLIAKLAPILRNGRIDMATEMPKQIVVQAPAQKQAPGDVKPVAKKEAEKIASSSPKTAAKPALVEHPGDKIFTADEYRAHQVTEGYYRRAAYMQEEYEKCLAGMPDY